MGYGVDSSTCKKCRLCIEVCPCNILEVDTNDQVRFIKEREVICQRCGQCMAVCSTQSVNVEGLSYEKDFHHLPKNEMDYTRFSGFLATRRSIRNYKNKPVPEKLIRQVLEATGYAPYGSEPQKMHITVINNRKTIASALPYMEEFLDNIVKWLDHPIASRMIKRRNKPETFNTLKNHVYPISLLGNYKLKYGDRITRDAPALIIFHANKGAEEHSNNSLIFATYSMLAAHALGLGATLTGIISPAINKVKEVREIFQIPEEHEAVISMILGYPKYTYQRSIKRQLQHIQWLQ